MDSGLRVLLSTVLCLSQSLIISCLSQYPSLRSEPTSVVQSPGSVVRLQCLVSPPSAAVSWRFRGLPLDQDTLPGVELGQGSLVIPNLTPDHAGVYQCVARLGHGPAVASRLARVALAEIEEYEAGRRRPLSAQEGSTVVIECPLPRSTPPARPRLRVRGDWIEESRDNYLILPSGNLQIISVSAQQQGMYKCGAVNPVTGAAVVQSHGVKLSVKQPSSSSPSSSAQIVYPAAPVTVSMQHSQPLTLECIVSGSPAPAARWFKNGKEFALGPSHQRQHNNLAFPRLTRSDEGRYSCRVETERGTEIGPDYTVNVLEPASIVEGPDDQLVPLDSSARFTCSARGNPSPNITWLFNAEPITPSRHFQISGSSLVIADATPQDEGVYQCLLDNGIGSAQSHGILTIWSGPQLGATAGVLLEASPSLHPIQSDGSFLTEDDDPFNPPAERSGDRSTPEAPIIISPPQTHKPDVYDLEWRAGRDGGSPISAYFVKYRKVDDMGTVVGSWQTVRVPGSEKTLRLSELEPSSLYEVLMVARSSAGEGQPAMLTFRTAKEKTTSSSNKNPSKPSNIPIPPKVLEDRPTKTNYGVVLHDRVPEAPDRPTISMATDSSVYVAWIPRANGGSPVTAFRVEYRRGRSAEWLVAADNISPLKLSVEIRNLEPGSTYKFRVLASNTYGDSLPSTPSKPYQVPPASPRKADRPVVGPHILATDAISDTQIMLRWTYDPSSNNNTPIQGFYIYYRPTDSDNDSDYKRDLVEGVKTWHMIGHLQPETSYDIKMQCFNGGGESDYSNVMICETRARQSPDSPSQHPFTPPGPHPPDPPEPPRLLYLIVGCVLGVMVLILLSFIAMCLWRNRQQNNMHKYDPPGYLYQPADLNGHVLEYTTLAAGGGRVNGGVHGGYGGQMLAQGCHHLHHKLPNGLALLNGSGGFISPGHPHGHEGPLSHGTHECEHPHPHPHHHLNGGGLYTALPQKETSDCMSCQNLCNNNRCYSKTNGALPLMHRVAPCHQDGLEMVPLGQVSPQRCGSDSEADAGFQLPDGNGEPSPSQHSCCLIRNNKHAPGDSTGGEEPEDSVRMEDHVVSWGGLGLPDLDCDKKPGWISSSSLVGELIQAGPQEA
ncbi:cell adhesion molecule-related/down-regulated by oncogenes [Anableps anableps]